MLFLYHFFNFQKHATKLFKFSKLIYQRKHFDMLQFHNKISALDGALFIRAKSISKQILRASQGIFYVVLRSF